MAISSIISPCRDAVRVMPGGRGEGGARGRGLISFAPGRSGHHVCRHYDRRARCVAGSGRIVGGVTPAPWTVCPRNLARIAPRDHTPLGKNRGGTPAGERARSGRAAQAAFSVARPHPFGAGLTTVRLPAFRFPLFLCRSRSRMNEVKSGSGIEARRSYPDFAPLHPGYRRRAVRHRCLTSLARACARENEIARLHFSPRGEKGERAS